MIADKNKSIDFLKSCSERLTYFEYVTHFIFDRDHWTTIRLSELWDKIYGNHR